MQEWEVYVHVAAAVAEKASEEGVARRPMTYEEELVNARNVIERARKVLISLMDLKLIKPFPQVD
jgi:malate dehydrogenase (oxaloacetate-decarboxylating)